LSKTGRPSLGSIEAYRRDYRGTGFLSLPSGWDNLAVLAKSIGDIPKSKITEVLERVTLLDRPKTSTALFDGDETAAGHRLDTITRPGADHSG